MKAKVGISIAFIIFLLIPVFLVFKSFFLPGSLAWGDAPHFYPEGIRELVGEPLAWTNRGASFGGINTFLFLSPLMLMYGLLGSLIGNDLAIRLLFYFPSLVVAALGTYFFTRYLKFSKTVQFFTIFTYLLNSYFLLLIDGGQIGVALAYGFFPFTLLFLKKLVDTPSLATFYLSLILLSFLSIVDPRIAAIAVIAIIVWSLIEMKIRSFLYLIPLGAAVLGISMYWLFPTAKNGEVVTIVLANTNIRWYDPLLLFSPHWPANLFGQIVRPPWYFLGVPIFILGGILLDHSRKLITIALIFLIFGLLSLGLPLLDKIPYGFAFRDSTKFYIPLILFGGILMGNTIQSILQKLQKRKVIYYLSLISFYLYLIFLIWPALLGKMNFVLSGRQDSSDLQKIYENLKPDSGFFRTVWIPEKHPLSYETSVTPAIDARELANFWPFASINAGEDSFNFFNNQNFPEILRVLGVKYLFLSDNPREILKNEKGERDWQTINGLISENKSLKKVDWGTKMPVYEIENSYPRFFAVRQLAAVVGSSLMPSVQSIIPSIYFEDGKWDPETLIGKDPNSIVLMFNGGDKTDISMSFLQKYFVSGERAVKNEWAKYSSGEYLKYKYELLIRGVKFTDLDYSKGISFSTKKGEKMEFAFDVPNSGNYVFAVRTMKPFNKETILNWKINDLTLIKGKHIEIIDNTSDLTIFNVAALIPKKDFDDATDLANGLTKTFKTADVGGLSSPEAHQEVAMENFGTLKYKFQMPEGNYWLIFSDNYNPLWQLRQGNEYRPSLPVYSMVNGFYAEDGWSNIGIEFKGQENIRWGIYFSVLSILALGIIFLLIYEKKNN